MDCSTSGFPVFHYRSVCPDSCPLSQWYYLTTSSFVTPFSSCLQSFLASGSFSMSRLFASGSPSIRASTSASVLPMNIQGWFPLGWTGLISLLSKGLSKVFSSTTVRKHRFFSDLTLIEGKINCYTMKWVNVQVPSFSWLKHTLLYVYITFSSPIHLLMDIWVVSTSWLLWIMLAVNMGVLISLSEYMPATQMNFEDIMLNEISQSQEDILHDSTYMMYLRESNS